MKYVWVILGSFVIFALVLNFGYQFGYTKGTLTKENEYLTLIKEKESEYRTREKEFRDEVTKIEQQAIKDKEMYDISINELHDSYDGRLSESERRADYYRRLAAEGNTQCNLPAHTAELDRALTEGTELVEELIEHVELRNSQLRRVGEYLEKESKLHD